MAAVTTAPEEDPAARYRRKLVKQIAAEIANSGYWDNADDISKILVDNHFPPLPSTALVTLSHRSRYSTAARPYQHRYRTYLNGDGDCACPRTEAQKVRDLAERLGYSRSALELSEWHCDREGCRNGQQ